MRSKLSILHSRSSMTGVSLIELMISITISLLVLAALLGLFVNTSRSTAEMVNTNDLIDNGRFTVQLLQDDIAHAGFWGGYIPQFDDLTSSVVPGDVPLTVPNPCQAFNAWDGNYRNAILGIAVQAYDALPSGTGCLSPLTPRANSDVLVVRHVETCIPDVGDCDASVAGKLYFQPSFCEAEKNAGTAQTATSNDITLASTASAVDNTYVGLTIRTVSGAGAGQYRTITAYTGGTRLATISPAWATIPNNTTTYAFEYMLGTNGYPLYVKNCVGTGSPASLPITAGTIADKRKFISNIFYVTNFVHPDHANQVVPTLVRSQLDLVNGALVQQAPVAMIDGVDAFHVELGIDNVSKSGAAVDYTQAVAWADPTNKVLPTNRGDGAPDNWIRCTTASPCTAAQLTNVVAVKLYVLARSRDTTPGYTDTKTYCLGAANIDGSCPSANTIAPANDHYKRHVIATSVRLTNISGRRETP